MWQAEQILSFGIERLTFVISPCVVVTWQTVQLVPIAECTNLPVILLAWHEAHSLPVGTTPGCSTALADPASRSSKASRLECSRIIRTGNFSHRGKSKHY